MRRPLLRRAADLLAVAGVGDPAFRAFERLQALAAPRSNDPEVPPAYLRVLTAGFADPALFVAQGKAAAAEFLQLARQYGPELRPSDAVLEFGCGSGRVARWFTEGCDAAFHGCDINPRLIAWCRERLRGRYDVSDLDPPSPYPTASFDLIYALSVFTHMHEPVARAWLQELARVAKPGSLALLTFLDRRLPQAARLEEELAAEGFAIRSEGAEGSNLLCGYFSDSGFADRAGPRWRWMGCVPSDRSATGQAVAILRRDYAAFDPRPRG